MTIITYALILGISTSIDYFLILFLLFSQAKKPGEKRTIYFGQLLASFILILLSSILSQVANIFLADWILGLLGFVPILLGARILFENEVETDIPDSKIGLLSIMFISLASGVDNLGIFTPYFTTLSTLETLLTAGLILLETVAICYLAEKFGSLHSISEFIEKYEKMILPTIFIILGIYILFEFGTMTYLLQLLT
ncbi:MULTISPECIES: cadmium resistance transporter [Streptococcus]|uniref:Cadmium resistance protein n=2 Tax=Streptococcus suis TaxID=1307 RepID=A0A0Z8H088_STRSU|nr:cadmium resistance transporter [Streptococcus suis]MBM0194965.1 cadmium resistance transporter [Streptococcus suis]MBM7316334.1 cadmium resistance transporter [Streptococcus suis]MCK4019218.1 cadmium resistance protein [Streptococcus suis]MCK4075078.1 cadmium resistance protein [Streptococcus suis]NQH52637.1 cadmium resistance protein [Streptococcus suis]